MREGPLAALFRRTDGDEAGAHAASAGDRTAPTPTTRSTASRGASGTRIAGEIGRSRMFSGMSGEKT